jgi:sigma-54 specific flagellar transcriptional regulator A
MLNRGAFQQVEPDRIVADSGLVHAATSSLVEVKRTCVRIAPTDATVLLTGETGTGKEVFARLIHGRSNRGNRSFVPVNCGAIPEALLESELFGYVRGAFTGAVTSRRGRVALAEGGTLFLDEIGELPLSLQVKLLRLLQERTYEPVGSAESVSANFRLIAATNRNLEEEVRGGRFRRDLYYRLHVCPVHLPPLRDRREDVAPLFTHFWRARGEQRPVAPDVLRRLEAYAWPGNVRELENVVERISVCSESPVIHGGDLPAMIHGEGDREMPELIEARLRLDEPLAVTPPPAGEAMLVSSSGLMHPMATPPSAPLPLSEIDGQSDVIELPPPMPAPAAEALALPVDLPRLLRDLEGAYISKALGQTGGNKKEAAKLLGMGRTTLVEKLRRRNTDASDL